MLKRIHFIVLWMNYFCSAIKRKSQWKVIFTTGKQTLLLSWWDISQTDQLSVTRCRFVKIKTSLQGRFTFDDCAMGPRQRSDSKNLKHVRPLGFHWKTALFPTSLFTCFLVPISLVTRKPSPLPPGFLMANILEVPALEFLGSRSATLSLPIGMKERKIQLSWQLRS